MKKEEKIDIKQIILQGFYETKISKERKEVAEFVCEQISNFRGLLNKNQQVEFSKIIDLMEREHCLTEDSLLCYVLQFVKSIFIEF